MPETKGYQELSTTQHGADDAAALREVLADLYEANNHEPLTLEKGSVWGTAVVMPQIARSASWNSVFVILCFRVYLNYVLCIILSLGLLTYIGEETHVMNPLGGQMHLCDFGAALDQCPEGEHCVGPGGTKFTSTRMYGYEQWAIQRFVKQAFLDIVPDKEDIINEKVDPGEYGVENYWCRLAAVLMFSISMVPEILALLRYVYFFWGIPTGPESWIQYSKPGAESDAEADPWARVSFKVAGIPLCWKLFYLVVLIIPRIMICHFVLWEGVQLLMETSGITDSVMSAVSMTFIADIGGMIFTCLAPPPVPPIMSRLQPPQSPPHDRENPNIWRLMVPEKVVILLLTMVIYVFMYYQEKCTETADGSWVSQDMYLPQSTRYTVENLVLRNLKLAKDAFWSMPHEQD